MKILGVTDRSRSVTVTDRSRSVTVTAAPSALVSIADRSGPCAAPVISLT